MENININFIPPPEYKYYKHDDGKWRAYLCLDELTEIKAVQNIKSIYKNIINKYEHHTSQKYIIATNHTSKHGIIYIILI